MRKVVASAVVIAGVCGFMTAAQAAEGKPISELPGDLVRWSTLWMDIPRAMYDVGMEEGPLTAVTWGPVKGTAILMNTTTHTLWDAAQPETRRGHKSRASRTPGVIFQYEF